MEKLKIKNYLSLLLLIALPSLIISCEKDSGNKIVDFEGNVYNTVSIGTQVWIKENLRTTRLNDGTKIQLMPDGSDWENLKTPGYCWYGNHEAFFSLNHYGALYNGYAVNSGKLCPLGWHIPKDEDWHELSLYVGMDSGGGKLKETGTVDWIIPNSDASNETGFTALPGGYRRAYYKDYSSFRYRAYFWTFTSAESFELNGSNSNVTSRPFIQQNDGASVRCIKDSK